MRSLILIIANAMAQMDSPLNIRLLRFLRKGRVFESGFVYNDDYHFDQKWIHTLSIKRGDTGEIHIKIDEIVGIANAIIVRKGSEECQTSLDSIDQVIDFIDDFDWNNSKLERIDTSNYEPIDPIDYKNLRRKGL